MDWGRLYAGFTGAATGLRLGPQLIFWICDSFGFSDSQQSIFLCLIEIYKTRMRVHQTRIPQGSGAATHPLAPETHPNSHQVPVVLFSQAEVRFQ